MIRVFMCSCGVVALVGHITERQLVAQEDEQLAQAKHEADMAVCLCRPIMYPIINSVITWCAR